MREVLNHLWYIMPGWDISIGHIMKINGVKDRFGES